MEESPEGLNQNEWIVHNNNNHVSIAKASLASENVPSVGLEGPKFTPQDFRSELRYSLWTDLSGE